MSNSETTTAQLTLLSRRLERAERALVRAGWTYTEGAEEWKPPLGQSALPLLDELDRLRAQVERPKDREAFIGVIASLAAAISLLERIPNAKKAAPSDMMFEQMLTDYRRALEAGRSVIKGEPQTPEDCAHRIRVTPRNGAPHGAGFACSLSGGHCLPKDGCGYTAITSADGGGK